MPKDRDKVVENIKIAAQFIIDNAEEFATMIPYLSEADITIKFRWDSVTTVELNNVYAAKGEYNDQILL